MVYWNRVRCVQNEIIYNISVVTVIVELISFWLYKVSYLKLSSSCLLIYSRITYNNYCLNNLNGLRSLYLIALKCHSEWLYPE